MIIVNTLTTEVITVNTFTIEVITVNTLTNEDHSTVEGVITVNTLTKGSQYYGGDHSQYID